MAAGIVYLDVDDEITSAAQRIRSSPGPRVALVVPYGSRIATSRMNFRLLSREAVVSNRRLSIIAGDAASRSLAASAGLPAFASVSEYEASGDRGAPPGGNRDVAAGTDRVAAAGLAEAAAGAAAAGAAAAGTLGLAASETVVAPNRLGMDAGSGGALADSPTIAMPAGRKSQRPKRPNPPAEDRPQQRAITLPERAGATGAGVVGPAAAVRPGGAAATVAPAAGAQGRRANDRDWRDNRADEATERAGRRRTRTPLLAALGLLALAAIVIGVGAYLFLPSASIAVTPRREPIGPIELTVSADPTATTVDPASNRVPAVRLDVPVEATRTFTTTGTRVEAAPAQGSVTFTNYDFTSQNTIPSGSLVSTEGGVRFRTLATVILPPATFVIPTSVPSRRSVAVEAVKDGPEGNVPANTIRVVPQGENPEFLKVNNGNETTGGSRTETPEVSAKEVDAALAAMATDLRAAFDAAIADGAGAPDGATVFPETASLGDPAPDGDPRALVGQAVETFDIRMTADGTVLAVDPTPVRSIAEARLENEVGEGERLVPGSVVITVGEGSVGEDGQITFLASARGTKVAEINADELRGLVKGRTAAEAKAALAPYGEAIVTLWPDWATTITAIDSRLSVTVDGVTGEGASPSASTRPTARPSRRPSPSPASAEPSPSAKASAASAAP